MARDADASFVEGDSIQNSVVGTWVRMALSKSEQKVNVFQTGGTSESNSVLGFCHLRKDLCETGKGEAVNDASDRVTEGSKGEGEKCQTVSGKMVMRMRRDLRGVNTESCSPTTIIRYENHSDPM